MGQQELRQPILVANTWDKLASCSRTPGHKKNLAQQNKSHVVCLKLQTHLDLVFSHNILKSKTLEKKKRVRDHSCHSTLLWWGQRDKADGEETRKGQRVRARPAWSWPLGGAMDTRHSGDTCLGCLPPSCIAGEPVTALPANTPSALGGSR